MQAIETRYKGYRFRSRLEARWAVYFDALGVDWAYEPEGFVLDDGTWYLPDFYIKDWNCYAEVKSIMFTEQQFNKCLQLDKPCLLLDCSPISDCGYFVTNAHDESRSYEFYLSGNEWGRALLQQSKYKGRLWFLWGESVDDYSYDFTPDIAALSARFEHGETPGG
jgi:hypothetical protein